MNLQNGLPGRIAGQRQDLSTWGYIGNSSQPDCSMCQEKISKLYSALFNILKFKSLASSAQE